MNHRGSSADEPAIRARSIAVRAAGTARPQRSQGDRVRRGFADGFPTEALSALLQAKLGHPQLCKADWIALASVTRA